MTHSSKKIQWRSATFVVGAIVGVGIGFFIAAVVGSGPRADYPDITLSVNGVRTDAVGHDPLIPEPGYHFVIADVTINNKTNSVLDISPLLNFYVKDASGSVYSEDAVPSEMQMHSGTLSAHDKLREEIGFMVKDGAEGLALYYEPGLVHNQVLRADLSSFLHK